MGKRTNHIYLYIGVSIWSSIFDDHTESHCKPNKDDIKVTSNMSGALLKHFIAIQGRNLSDPGKHSSFQSVP